MNKRTIWSVLLGMFAPMSLVIQAHDIHKSTWGIADEELASLSAVKAEPICRPLQTDQPESLRYVTNLIDGFWFAKSGYSGVQADSALTAQADRTEIISHAPGLMVSLKRASEDYECAATLVESFSTSTNRAITLSVQSTALAYRRLVTLNTEFQALLQNVLNEEPAAHSSLPDKISENKVQRDQAWEMLLDGTTAATSALVVVPQAKQEKKSRLNITLEQRKELSAKLEKTFGAVLKKEMPDVSPDASGWLLYEFINRKGWKLQPSK